MKLPIGLVVGIAIAIAFALAAALLYGFASFVQEIIKTL